jgi:hypothetical protein
MLRRSGVQSEFDVRSIASELAGFQRGSAGRYVVYDWSSIERWAYRAPSATEIAGWRCAAPAIKRLAIIHPPKWNQHAALLSALLRLGGAEVRSFHPAEREKALAWLNPKA